MKRSGWRLLGLSLAAFLCGGARADPAAPTEVRRPNIIVLLTDDQGYGDLSCHGNPVLRTPNLDRLHDEGVRFTDFHVSPTCSPTRATLMTRRHEFKSGVEVSLEAAVAGRVLRHLGRGGDRQQDEARQGGEEADRRHGDPSHRATGDGRVALLLRRGGKAPQPAVI
jgi:arylsulfatase A-like enzyme